MFCFRTLYNYLGTLCMMFIDFAILVLVEFVPTKYLTFYSCGLQKYLEWYTLGFKIAFLDKLALYFLWTINVLFVRNCVIPRKRRVFPCLTNLGKNNTEFPCCQTWNIPLTQCGFLDLFWPTFLQSPFKQILGHFWKFGQKWKYNFGQKGLQNILILKILGQK